MSIERLEAFFNAADQLDASDAEGGARSAGASGAPGSPGASADMDNITRKLSFSAGLAPAQEPVCALPNGSIELAGLSVGWGDAKAGEQGFDLPPPPPRLPLTHTRTNSPIQATRSPRSRISL